MGKTGIFYPFKTLDSVRTLENCGNSYLNRNVSTRIIRQKALQKERISFDFEFKRMKSQ